MSRTRPLFQFDAGWLFLAAGLALCVVVVLIPAQRDLFVLRQQLAELETRESQVNRKLMAYAAFLGELETSDVTLSARLAATQFNVLPAGETPLLLVARRDASVTDWIDESVPPATVATADWPNTRLTRLAIGPQRLWLLGAGVLSAFIGLLIGTETFTNVMRDHAGNSASDVPAEEMDEEITAALVYSREIDFNVGVPAASMEADSEDVADDEAALAWSDDNPHRDSVDGDDAWCEEEDAGATCEAPEDVETEVVEPIDEEEDGEEYDDEECEEDEYEEGELEGEDELDEGDGFDEADEVDAEDECATVDDVVGEDEFATEVEESDNDPEPGAALPELPVVADTDEVIESDDVDIVFLDVDSRLGRRSAL